MDYGTGRSTHADASSVSTRDDFAGFLSAALEDFRRGGEAEWENGTLDAFLEALAAFALDSMRDATDQRPPSWGYFAAMIVAATGYE